MGDVIDLDRARRRAAGLDEVDLGGALLTWAPARRVAHLVHEPGVVLDVAHAEVFGQALLRWVGTVPAAPYAVAVGGSEGADELGTRGYRRLMCRGAQRHRDTLVLVFYGGTATARFEAETYLRGTGCHGAVLDDAPAARTWLAANGFDGP